MCGLGRGHRRPFWRFWFFKLIKLRDQNRSNLRNRISGQNSIKPKFGGGGAEGLKLQKLFVSEQIDRESKVV